MLIEFGNTTVVPSWKLDETTATGYSRIYYVLKGEVFYEAENRSCQLKPGFLYVLPSTIPYKMHRNISYDFCCTYLHVSFPQGNVDDLIELEPVADTCLMFFIKTIQNAIRENKIDLLEHMADLFAEFLKGNEHFIHASEMLTAVQKYVKKHISERINIEDISQLFSYHPNYFIRLFREETGYTPHQYILQQRMQYAVVLLNKEHSNEAVCTACGYTDSSTFTRAFREFYGVTPQKYIKGYRKP